MLRLALRLCSAPSKFNCQVMRQLRLAGVRLDLVGNRRVGCP